MAGFRLLFGVSGILDFALENRLCKIAVSANLPADNFLDVLDRTAGRVLTPRFVLPAAIAAAAGGHKILRLVAPAFAVGGQVVKRHVFLFRSVQVLPAINAMEFVAKVNREAQVLANLNASVTAL